MATMRAAATFDEYDDATLPPRRRRDRFVDLDFDSDVDEEIAVPGLCAAERVAPRQRRGMLIAAIVGGVALLGGVGALALSFGKAKARMCRSSSRPMTARSRSSRRIRAAPAVPNQDNKVYDAVKGADGTATAPAQERLVTTSEEPVDMAAVDKADTTELPGVADEEDMISESRRSGRSGRQRR